MKRMDEYLTPEQRSVLSGLNTPHKIQEYLDKVAYNREDINRSPIRVMDEMQAHCLDGGVFGAAALMRLGHPPLIVDLLPIPDGDDDHILAVFQMYGCYGALAKSNYNGLRFREPIYKSLRQLVLSYFEDFYNLEGVKSLRRYTRLINLEKFDRENWLYQDHGVDVIEKYLKKIKGYNLFTQDQTNFFSRVDDLSRRAGMLGCNPDGLFQPPHK
jgi:hypothetical protein